ncbi:hypothetical protein [Virgibacillus halodenitrificans]|uniref:hypothetical protein n=1 Tax=Virgibacillus halodenitrificans TaxID=1482 RepID=UPI000EF512A8|nr:hypothetical protein [Virgibacillus halodenitrificans]
MAQLTLEEQRELRMKALKMIDETRWMIEEKRDELGNKGAFNWFNRECPEGKEIQKIGQLLLNARG